jgi:uncharacterized protein YjbI with pentapeptide repeats
VHPSVEQENIMNYPSDLPKQETSSLSRLETKAKNQLVWKLLISGFIWLINSIPKLLQFSALVLLIKYIWIDIPQNQVNSIQNNWKVIADAKNFATEQTKTSTSKNINYIPLKFALQSLTKQCPYPDRMKRGLDSLLFDIRYAFVDRPYCSQLSYLNLENFYLPNITLEHASLQYTSFAGSLLLNSNFKGADLQYANLQAANLKKAEFTCSPLKNAIPDKNEPRCANLTGAQLNNTKLQNANLTGANLNNAQLQNANLTGANLNNAQLQNANLTKANLTGAKLNNAIFCQTMMPNGSMNNANCQK